MSGAGRAWRLGEAASVGEFLLELLSEEIPARMQRRAADLTALVRGKLAAARNPGRDASRYVTPRRLTVIAEGIPHTSPTA